MFFCSFSNSPLTFFLTCSFVHSELKTINERNYTGISQGPPGDGPSLPVIPQGGPQGQGVDGQYQSAPGVFFIYLFVFILSHLFSFCYWLHVIHSALFSSECFVIKSCSHRYLIPFTVRIVLFYEIKPSYDSQLYFAIWLFIIFRNLLLYSASTFFDTSYKQTDTDTYAYAHTHTGGQHLMPMYQQGKSKEYSRFYFSFLHYRYYVSHPFSFRLLLVSFFSTLHIFRGPFFCFIIHTLRPPFASHQLDHIITLIYVESSWNTFHLSTHSLFHLLQFLI